MSDVSRRDAMKLAAALAVGASAAVAGEALCQEAAPTPEATADPQLEAALKNAGGFMFAEQVTFQTKTDGRHFNLYFTSARPSRHNTAPVDVRLGSMRIFRADADRDDFTKQGGLYWRCGDTEGKVQFKKPNSWYGKLGRLVLVVRDMDGTVHCYSLVPDLRC